MSLTNNAKHLSICRPVSLTSNDKVRAASYLVLSLSLANKEKSNIGGGPQALASRLPFAGRVLQTSALEVGNRDLHAGASD